MHVKDSNKDFKFKFFYVRAMRSAAKRQISEFENGVMVKVQFPLS